MKFWVGVFTTLLIVSPTTVVVTEYETIVREVERKPEWVKTPILDSFIDDWDEIERQSDCLFEYLQQHVGWEITLERVLTAGWWTDSLGGACAVIGEDNDNSLAKINTQDTP